MVEPDGTEIALALNCTFPKVSVHPPSGLIVNTPRGLGLITKVLEIESVHPLVALNTYQTV